MANAMTLEFHKRLNFESFWVENTNEAKNRAKLIKIVCFNCLDFI